MHGLNEFENQWLDVLNESGWKYDRESAGAWVFTSPQTSEVEVFVIAGSDNLYPHWEIRVGGHITTSQGTSPDSLREIISHAAQMSLPEEFESTVRFEREPHGEVDADDMHELGIRWASCCVVEVDTRSKIGAAGTKGMFLTGVSFAADGITVEKFTFSAAKIRAQKFPAFTAHSVAQQIAKKFVTNTNVVDEVPE